MRHSVLSALLLAATTLTGQTAQAQQKADTDWAGQLAKRITLHGYAQAGYAYNDAGGNTTSDFNLKRTIMWGTAQITDRWSALLMYDFSGVVHEFYTDFRITNNQALTIRLGQFKNSFTMENPMAPVTLELIDLCAQSVACLAGCGADPLFGVNYGRDMGLMLYGSLAGQHLSYELAVMNGQGVNKRDGNSDKDVLVKLEYRPADGLRIVASAQKGRGHAVGTAPWNPDIKVGDNYRRDRASIGAEWKSQPYAAGPYKEAHAASVRAELLAGRDGCVNSRGAYATSTIPLAKGVDAIASIDYFDRNTSLNYRQTQATAGLQYWFYKMCRVQLQYTRTWSNYQPDYNWIQGQMQVAF